MNNIVIIMLLVVALYQVMATPTTIITADGKSYLLERSERYNWYEAFIECAKRGLRLVALDSADKNNALVTVLKTSGYSRIWIGLIESSLSGNRKFYWSSTGLEQKLSYWQRGEPNGRGEENCVHMDNPDYRWNDNNCANNKLGFICEL